MRLDRYLANLKYGTRNEITKKIKSKKVTVNGIVVTDSRYKVDTINDLVILEGIEIFYKETVLLMVHKPAGVISANKDGLHETVLDLIGEPYNRFDLRIAGRLDIDTEGLILLTNDGKLLHKIISPNKDVYKKYYVKTESKFDSKKLLKQFEIKDGRDIMFTPLLPKVEEISDNEFYLSIKEGKFHQVKRMVEHFNNKVVYLKRVSIGNIELDKDLEKGRYKEIIEYKI
ncbi:MAG: Ribosomal small subunit pseudouridine synthase A [Candidatus Izimaplasma bacterium HR2]|nr:MAG: Ribosomal small subunit pseudouridine synthase A [Candidatus Izimaplasma bacterium HR2]